MFAQFAKRESKNDTIFPRKIPKKKKNFNNLIGIDEFFRFMFFFLNFEFFVLKKVKILKSLFCGSCKQFGEEGVFAI